jgi:hypothetical protein
MPVMVSPDGSIGEIPQENVTAAQASGFRLMSQDDMQRLHNRLFLADKFFEKRHPKVTNWRLPRGRGRW